MAIDWWTAVIMVRIIAWASMAQQQDGGLKVDVAYPTNGPAVAA
jgi:hypothetical protein